MLGLETRFRLAQEAFRMIAAYDETIARYLSAQTPAAMRGAYSVLERS